MKAVVSILTHHQQVLPGRPAEPAGRGAAADETPPHDRSAEGVRTIWTVRGLLLLQIVIFLALVAIHVGPPMGGYRRPAAGTTESVLAAVLAAGLLLTWAPLWRRRAAIAAQSFGTVGVLVGLFTIAPGSGPRTILDLPLNGVLLLALMAGLAMTLRKL